MDADLPNPASARIISGCAQMVAPILVSLESAQLQVEVFRDGHRWASPIRADMARRIDDYIDRAARECSLRNAGTHMVMEQISPEQYRYVRKGVMDAAYKIARPRIDQERELVLGVAPTSPEQKPGEG